MQWNLVTHRKISLNQHSVHTNTTHNNMDPISDWFFFCCSLCCALYVLSPCLCFRRFRWVSRVSIFPLHCVCLFVLYHIHISFQCATTVATLLLLLPLIFVCCIFLVFVSSSSKIPMYIHICAFYPKRIGKLSAATVFRLRREHYQRVPPFRCCVSVVPKNEHIFPFLLLDSPSLRSGECVVCRAATATITTMPKKRNKARQQIMGQILSLSPHTAAFSMCRCECWSCSIAFITI